jgi:adenine-specific DNA methylase
MPTGQASRAVTAPPARASDDHAARFHRFPPTRYQGSKRKTAIAILAALDHLEYHTVLDAFGGSAAVAYAFKCAGKAVTYNDRLAFNHQIGRALIENHGQPLSDGEIDAVGRRRPDRRYGAVVRDTFSGIYYTDEENEWLDVARANIEATPDPHRRAMAWFALFQSAMAKRPYNLFHRSNLYMRTADVTRSFGNKASWDRPFDMHFRKFAMQANRALLDTGVTCRATRGDALEIDGRFDLVYIDPPYVSARGAGVDYRDFYHFLEGLLEYDHWPEMIDQSSKHRRLVRINDPWAGADTIRDMFRRLFDRFRDARLAVSYRDDGIPAVPEISDMLRSRGKTVQVIDIGRNQYALSTRRRSREVLLVAT